MRRFAIPMQVLMMLMLGAPLLPAADRPNGLAVMADDCTFSDLPVCGVKTTK